ncbi:MAG: deoxyribonuclease V [Dehalococcoidia bacterium]|nr:MAG: deoxyribonuclease V [Dehalococcoidia bacterium]
MEVTDLHGWRLSPAAAIGLQKSLAVRVSKKWQKRAVRFVAGTDISVERDGRARAAVVVLNYPGLETVEVSAVEGRLDFPYIPGLLSFREIPLLLAAFRKLATVPDMVLVDGQGLAHPRRFGIACHLGLFLGIPAIGCAKSRLVGSHAEPGQNPGEYALLRDNGEVIGAALRTRAGTKPVYVSIGHRISLNMSIKWVMRCLGGYRLPEPARLAHQAAGGNLRLIKSVCTR